ncbi:hypothetical protein [Pelomonas sp. SE-A7]|uniref:DUF6968 family protein n=1 Tax=Pelomonas sp. SE-A7 TaxID=3054953 RepID=UPI00259CD53E|nr:hypothetical protein [Pelomonas sp. SE-A7]MDM4767192.1 hypothetical protein [Pelomonas sp. SE-A7]
MTMFAERILQAIAPDDEEFEMKIRVGSPRPDGDDWSCLVSITRIFETPRELLGVDSWQAVQVSLQFVSTMLDDFVRRGGQLFWPGTTDVVCPASMFVQPADRLVGNEDA